ncbi:MAG: SGNH/GDSL hydrolase family protein [Bacteroidota bacterium]
MLKFIYIFFLSLSIEGLIAQDFHPWCYRPENEYGKYISRTLTKLEKSSYSDPQDVNIIVYGQSLSKQNWWEILKDSLSRRYPSVNLNMINRSIGGFPSQKLWKTTNFDILPEYPDLVIFHVFGSHTHYEKILKMIRSRTSSEVLVWNDPYTKENRWSDTMSYYLIPEYCENFKLEFANIRSAWKSYFESEETKPEEFTRKDGSHLNEKGNGLLARMLLQYFNYDPGFGKDPFHLSDTLDLNFKKDINRMDLEFTGNAIQIILEDSIPENQKFRILVNGLPPGSFPEGYYNTRPNDYPEKDWPWETGAVYHLENISEPENEIWNIRLIDRDDSLNRFSFELHGSVSGFDGAGSSRLPFVSNSGKIVIQPEDWFIKQAWLHSGIQIQKGYEVHWKTYTKATDFIIPLMSGEKSWIIQGLKNGEHLLQIVAFGDYPLPIKKIIIHKPYLF